MDPPVEEEDSSLNSYSDPREKELGVRQTRFKARIPRRGLKRQRNGAIRRRDGETGAFSG